MPNGRGGPPPPPQTPPPARVSVPRRESSRGRGEVLKEAGGRRPPASLRSSPSPPLTIVSAAWSSSPGGEPLACARDPGRGEGGEAEGLAECEGLPPRTSGTGHQMDQFSGQGAFHHCVGVRLIRVMRANLRARKPFARRSCPRARHGGGTSDWWSAGGYPRRDEWQFRGAAGPDVPPCCGGLRKEQNPRLDHDPATRRLPAPEGSGSRRMAELGTANRFPAP